MSTPREPEGSAPLKRPDPADDPPQPSLLVAVVIVEVLTIAALWAFGCYFGA